MRDNLCDGKYDARDTDGLLLMKGMFSKEFGAQDSGGVFGKLFLVREIVRGRLCG